MSEEVKEKTLWDVLNNLLQHKKYDYSELKESDVFIVNRAVSKNADCLFYANEINLYPGIDTRWVYDFYFFSIPPKKRFAKWFKNSRDEELLSIIKDIYSVSVPVAESYLKLLSEEEKIALKASKGGVKI